MDIQDKQQASPEKTPHLSPGAEDQKTVEANTRNADCSSARAEQLAHDLGNELGPIRMSIHLLRERIHDEKGLQIVETIAACAQRATDMLQQILELGKGTANQQLEPQNMPSPKLTEEEPTEKGRLILVIDDELSIRTVLEHTLESLDYRALMAADGDEGLALFREHAESVAAVVVDLAMPQPDGPTTIQALRELNSRLPIIATSGRPVAVQKEKVSHLGVQHYLHKPYTTKVLVQVLDEVFNPQRSHPDSSRQSTKDLD